MRCLGICKQLRVFICYWLEDGHSVIPYYLLVVCQHLRFIVQHTLQVCIEPHTFSVAADAFFMYHDVVQNVTFAAGCHMPVRLM